MQWLDQWLSWWDSLTTAHAFAVAVPFIVAAGGLIAQRLRDTRRRRDAAGARH